MTKKSTIAIIGAGYIGLTAAYRLSKAGHEVQVFEKDSFSGGLASSFSIAGNYLEKYYHHIFLTDKALLNLLNELGLESKLQWHHPKSASYYNGQILDLSSPGTLLKTNEIPNAEKFRFLALMAKIKFSPNSFNTASDNLTAEQWFTNTVGPRMFQILWQPLLEGKFGKNADQISAAWLHGRIKARLQTRDRLNRETLGYLSGGGLHLFTETLTSEIHKLGGRLSLSSPVLHIGSSPKLHLMTKNKKLFFDHIIYTGNPQTLSKITDLPKYYTDKLSRLHFQSVVCAALTLKNPLSNIYWLNIHDTSLPFTAVIEHTNFIPATDYQNNHLVYLSKYVSPDHPYMTADATSLQKTFTNGLKKIYPHFQSKNIKDFTVFKDEYAQPITGTGYAEHILPIETPIKNLHMVNMSQIYPQDRGLNFAIEQGHQIANQILVEP